MRQQFVWYLFLLVVLSALYGYTQYRAAAGMGASARRARINLFAAALSGTVLSVAWTLWGFPLPVFYVLAYLCRAVRLVGSGTARRRELFILNLSYINTMALHLFIIGVAALAQGHPMHVLLSSEIWRATSSAVLLSASIVEDFLFLRKPQLPAMLAAEAESMEARPFMAFLWFCTGYLLVDSFLCVAKLEPLYLRFSSSEASPF